MIIANYLTPAEHSIQSVCTMSSAIMFHSCLQDVTISAVIEAENGLKFYLVEVIAMMLKHIVSHLLNVEMNGNTRQIDSVFDFDWVITVPAIWKAGGKQMMREAAYMVSVDEKLILIM